MTREERTEQILSRTFSADIITPITAFAQIKLDDPQAILLESLDDKAQTGRFSHIGFDVIHRLSLQDQQLTHTQQMNDKQEQTTQTLDTDALIPALRAHYAAIRVAADDPRVAIVGGLVGHFNYESVGYFESCARHPSQQGLPVVELKSFAGGLTFDHQTQELIISLRCPRGEPKNQIIQRIKQLFERIASPSPLSQLDTHGMNVMEFPKGTVVDVDDASFEQRITQAKQHIIDGDAFQIVISRQFKTPFKGEPLDVYRALRHLNPSPYMFYLPMHSGTIVGASPEKLVSLHKSVLEVNPLAGTRPRGQTSAEENTLARELAEDNKECAEHMMLVDLARNDLGRVSALGSVQVKNLLQVKKYRHVMHLSSQVNGILADGLDAFDALAATFPAGTLSGAPKIRAMEIIHDLEGNSRDLYGGAVVVFDGDHNLESCIAIRMAYLEKDNANIRTGAGIVFDSDPQAESNETRIKAQSVLKAIHLAQGGLA